ncbi:MAG: hypothetical protein WD533_06545 [Dehalococcoidia bacterium]
MKVRIIGDQEQALRGYCLLLKRKPDAIASELFELGLVLLTSASLGKGEEMLKLVTEDEAIRPLRDAARRLWDAGQQAKEGA